MVFKREYIIIGFLYFCTWFFSSLIASLIAMVVLKNTIEDYLMATAYTNFFCFSLLIIITIYLTRNEWRRKISIQWDDIIKFILWAFFGSIVAILGQVVANELLSLLFNFEEVSQNTTTILKIIKLVPVFAVSTILFAPIMEEVVFRKILFGTFLQKHGFFTSAFLNSFLFAIIHFDFKHLLVYLVMGFTFSFIYYKTKRIVVPIAAHSLMNAIPIISMFYQ